MRDPKDLKMQLSNSRPDLPEDVLDLLTNTIVLRDSFVSDMAAAKLLSPEWNEASKRIFECDVILSNYDMV